MGKSEMDKNLIDPEMMFRYASGLSIYSDYDMKVQLFESINHHATHVSINYGPYRLNRMITHNYHEPSLTQDQIKKEVERMKTELKEYAIARDVLNSINCDVDKHLYPFTMITFSGKNIYIAFAPQPDITTYEHILCQKILTGEITGNRYRFMFDNNLMRHWVELKKGPTQDQIITGKVAL